MASALSEADGIDYTDPEEVKIFWIYVFFMMEKLVDFFLVFLSFLISFGQLELLIAALIDLDAMDGKSSVSLLAECSSSPDESTR